MEHSAIEKLEKQVLLERIVEYARYMNWSE